MELTHIAAREGRLSSFLRVEMALSAGLMNRLKWKDRILVNGQPEHTDFPVKIGTNLYFRIILLYYTTQKQTYQAFFYFFEKKLEKFLFLKINCYFSRAIR